MERLLAIALLVIVSTARDDQTGDCLRRGDCRDARLEQTQRISTY